MWKWSASSFGLLYMAVAANAENIPRMDIIDFAVDWAKYEGQVVMIDGGVVINANTEFAQIAANGVNITLQPPWQNREDLRFILRHCTVGMRAPECKMSVGGVVQRSSYKDGPELTNVVFQTPK